MEVKPGLYEHFKGKRYRVIGIARHSETEEDYIVYEPQYESVSKLWIRPLAMFTETVERDGKTMPRFRYIGEE